MSCVVSALEEVGKGGKEGRKEMDGRITIMRNVKTPGSLCIQPKWKEGKTG